MFDKPSNKPADYQFSEPESTSCVACSHVLDELAPVLYVAHNENDGMWQFLCGAENHESHQKTIVSLGAVAALHPSVNDLNDMPLAMAATRTSIDARWKPFKL